MKIGMCYTYDELNLDMALEMIPKGFEPVECHISKKQFTLTTQDSDIKVFVTDRIDLEFIKTFRQKNPEIWVFLIYRPSQHYKDLLDVMKMGRVELIDYAQDASLMSEAIVNRVIQNQLRGQERRVHLRVHPAEHESNHVTIILKQLNNKVLNAKLLDLSCGGAALKFSDSLDASLIQVGHIYDFVNIHLRGKKIRVMGRVVGKRQTFSGMRFEFVDEKSMHAIAEYVYYKINHSDLNPLLGIR